MMLITPHVWPLTMYQVIRLTTVAIDAPNFDIISKCFLRNLQKLVRTNLTTKENADCPLVQLEDKAMMRKLQESLCSVKKW